MDRLDRADVDALRWLLRDDEPRAARQLARELKLLLVAAGKRSGQCRFVCAAHVELAGSAHRLAAAPRSPSGRGHAKKPSDGRATGSPRPALVSERPTRARSAGI